MIETAASPEAIAQLEASVQELNSAVTGINVTYCGKTKDGTKYKRWFSRTMEATG